MKALICTEPGNLEYKEVQYPALQKGHSIIQIKRIGICGTDLHAYDGTQPYFNYPRILGHELAANFVEGDTNEFSTGEALTIIPYINCGECIACKNNKPNCCVSLKVCGVHNDGGMQQYYSVPSGTLIKSNGLTHDELAMVEPLAIGAHAVRRAAIQKEETVLIIGAGPIGVGAMEFAKLAGTKVIALDINKNRLQFCKQQLNIEYTINAAEEDVLKRLKEITNADMPVVVMDATGNQKAINNALQYVAHGGRFVLVGLQKQEISFSHPEFHKRETTLMSSRNATRQDFEHVINAIKNKWVDPSKFITHHIKFNDLKNRMETWKEIEGDVIKAVVELD